ncbi:TSUP family transporter [Streptomyces sp. NPDC055955]|uniref:TSUP family transporter n=1 Tax=Streptomyces sp. NPDC055955 TaxID=3345665 RepID=UPI0035DC460C
MVLSTRRAVPADGTSPGIRRSHDRNLGSGAQCVEPLQGAGRLDGAHGSRPAVTHTTTLDTLDLPLWAQVPAGVMAGFGIGVVAAIMGVAGGELLIPTIVLLFGENIKTAGSLSLLVSLPTMLVAFARYSRDGSFAVLGANVRFTVLIAA